MKLLKALFYIAIFVVRVLAAAAFVFSTFFAVIFTLGEGLVSQTYFFWSGTLISALVITLTIPVWKKMKEATDFSDEKYIPRLLEATDTSPRVKQAIYAFQQNRATPDDVAAIAHLDILTDECLKILKQAHIHGIEEYLKDRRINGWYSTSDYLVVFSKIHNRHPSTEEALEALEFYLFSPQDVIQIISENHDFLPETVSALQEPDMDIDNVWDTFEKERKRKDKPLVDR